MSSVKVMMRQPDYDYVSTVAVLYGVSVPAALSMILHGVRENGLQLHLPKDGQSTATVPKPVPTISPIPQLVPPTAADPAWTEDMQELDFEDDD